MVIHPLANQQIKLLLPPKEVGTLEGKLEVGDIVNAMVKEVVGENKVILNLKGLNVLAHTFVVLERGQRVRVQVKEKKPKLILQLLSRKHHKFSTRDFIGILHHMGKRATRESIQIVKSLMEYNLPLSEESVEEISEWLRKLPRNGRRNIEALVFLKAHKLPITLHTIELTKTYLSEPPKLIERLQQIQTILPKFQSLDPKFIKFLMKLIETLPIKISEEEVQNQLRDFIWKIGLNYESNLLKFIIFLQEKENLERLIPSLRTNLKGQLLRLSSLLAGGISTPLFKRLKDLVDGAVKDISLLQLLGRSEGEVKYYYWLFPISTLLSEKAEIKIFYRNRERGKRIDMEDVTLYFLLHTTNLGVVSVRLKIQNRSIHCIIKVENEEVRSYIDKNKEKLGKRLEELNYCIQGFACLVDRRREEEFREEKVVDFQTLSRIDIKI